MPTARLAEFHANATRARDLVGLGQSIGQLTYGRVDASDLYRAALVQVVAVLDTYIHAIVEDRAVAIVVGRSMAPAPGPKFGLTPSAVADILSGGSPGLVELTARKHIASGLHWRPSSGRTILQPRLRLSALIKSGVSHFPIHKRRRSGWD